MLDSGKSQQSIDRSEFNVIFDEYLSIMKRRMIEDATNWYRDILNEIKREAEKPIGEDKDKKPIYRDPDKKEEFMRKQYYDKIIRRYEEMSKKIFNALGLTVLLTSFYRPHVLPDELFRQGDIEKALGELEPGKDIIVICKNPRDPEKPVRAGYTPPNFVNFPVPVEGKSESNPEYVQIYSYEFIEKLSDRYNVRMPPASVSEKTPHILALIGRKTAKGKKAKEAIEKSAEKLNAKAFPKDTDLELPTSEKNTEIEDKKLKEALENEENAGSVPEEDQGETKLDIQADPNKIFDNQESGKENKPSKDNKTFGQG